MGGRGARAATGGGGGGGGGLPGVTVTPNANGGVTITPTPPMNAQALAAGGAGVSDASTHTTYFTPADYATVSNLNTDGSRYSTNNGKYNNVGYYNTGDYYNINSELRELANGSRKALTPQTQKVVDAMDRNMRPLNADINSTRYTGLEAIQSNLGMPGASNQQIINRLKQGDVVSVKNDYTSSSWDATKSGVAGLGGRNVVVDMHYSKGAMVQFSPTRKEGELVGARGVAQRYANARMEKRTFVNARTGRTFRADALVVDCYVQ